MGLPENLYIGETVMKKILKISLVVMLFMFMTGCAGRVSEEDYGILMNFIEENTFIENIEKKDMIGAGEGEKVTYCFSGNLDGEKRDFTLKEIIPLDDSVVYEVVDATDGYQEIIQIRLYSDNTTEQYYSLNGYGEKNKAFLIDEAGFDENKAHYTAYHLARFNAGFIEGYENVSGDDSEIILINEEEKRYTVSYYDDVNVKTITDEEGNCLYRDKKEHS